MWFWRPRERFSLDELKYLTEQLQRATSVNDSNKEFVVETLRSIAELITWGDQHDPAFFDYFMEKQVMAHILRILKESSKDGSVTVQLLQTLSIIIGNIRSEHAIYYLFSNEHINNLITFPFDFRNEEVLAYYISFLRTISMKLDQTTVSFFIKTKNDKVVAFPLYSEAIKFFQHEESMVRIAVRTLTLNIYNVDDEGIRKFVMSKPVVNYFSDLVTFLRQQSINLDGLIAETSRVPESSQTVGRLEGSIAEIGDILFYCNDIISSGISDLHVLMSQHILNLLVMPVLLPSLCPMAVQSATSMVMQVSPLSSMYLLSRLLHILRRKPLVNGITAALLQTSQAPSVVSRANGDHQNCSLILPSLSLECPDSLRYEEGDLSNSHMTSANPSATAQTSSQMEEVVANPELPSERPRAIKQSEGGHALRSARGALLVHLFGNDDKMVMASLCVFVSLLQNEALDDKLLDALGLLPRRKRHKQLLLQALMGSKSDEETQLFSADAAEDDMAHDIHNLNVQDFEDFRLESDGTDLGSEKRRHRQEVLDALMQLICKRPPPCAEALWHAGWLLRQLQPYQEHTISNSSLSLLDSAYLGANRDVWREVADCWCDVIPAVLADEWKVCTKALDTPSLRRDSAYVLLPSGQDSLVEGDISSSAAGERMRSSVKVFVALHQMRHLLLEGALPEFPLLGQPIEIGNLNTQRVGIQVLDVRVGSEVNLDAGKAMPCRVAFERGKERAVFLLVVFKERGTSSWLLLVETIPSKIAQGVVRVIAPLAGSKPRVDEEHPRWLHLRIRSPHWPSAEAGKLGSSAPRTKRLVDGRWTLAFPDEESCRNAQSVVMEMIELQVQVVQSVLAPILGTSIPSITNSATVKLAL